MNVEKKAKDLSKMDLKGKMRSNMEDKEIKAMAKVNEVLSGLAEDEVARVLQWAADRFNVRGLKRQGGGSEGGSVTLATFLKQTKSTSSQVKRFLATAEWIHRSGKEALTTRDVSNGLDKNRQNKLSNPADCLNKNVTKGYCEKRTGGQFYVTDEGRKTLGINDG